MQGRKKGGQPGNVNALKHGQRSKRFMAIRRAECDAALEEDRAKSQAWADAAPKTDYAAICDAIRSSERTKHGW